MVLSEVFDKMHLPDSANRYYRLKDSLQARIFNRQQLNRVQDLAFAEQIHQQEEAVKAEELKERRRHNLQYAAITIILISLSVAFLLFSRKAAKYPRLVEYLGIIGLLIFFEFINLLLHPFLGGFTHESPLLMLLFMVLIAGLLVPLHHRLEGRLINRIGRRKSH